jgi:hypothetical protein
MKNLFIISFLAFSFFACKKDKTPNLADQQTSIIGTWKMTDARYSHMTEWHDIPSTDDSVVITLNHISNPWNTSYVRVNENAIIINGETINIFPTDSTMLWVSNLDSLRFIRL